MINGIFAFYVEFLNVECVHANEMAKREISTHICWNEPTARFPSPARTTFTTDFVFWIKHCWSFSTPKKKREIDKPRTHYHTYIYQATLWQRKIPFEPYENKSILEKLIQVDCNNQLYAVDNGNIIIDARHFMFIVTFRQSIKFNARD